MLRVTMVTTRDIYLARREKQQKRDEEKKEQRMKSSQAEKRKLEVITELSSGSSSCSPIHSPFQCRGAEEDAGSCVAGPSSVVITTPIKRTRSSKKIMNLQLSAG